MKLLIITQKVDKNDDVLGFFHNWIREFSTHAQEITVICLQKGEYKLPENVKVLSLGKENFHLSSFIAHFYAKLIYALRFWKYIWQSRRDYDAIFVHMNTEYVLLGAAIWKLLRKRIGIWYAHGTVTWKVRAAAMLSDVIFSSSKAGFRLNSKKLIITGQGIDTEIFAPKEKLNGGKSAAAGRMVSIGRISSVKHYEEMILAAKILKDRKVNFQMDIFGRPLTEKDNAYAGKLKQIIAENGLSEQVHLEGALSFHEVPAKLREYDIFLNVSKTGSLDKAVLEAMSADMIVLSANEAYKDILPKQYCIDHEPEHIADAVIYAMNSDKISMRQYVIKNHSLENLIRNILAGYKK